MTDFKTVMLISPQKVKTYGVINLNVNENEVGNAIRISQNIYLRDIIGGDLLEHVQELVYNKIKGLTPSIDDEENEAYKVLCDDYLVPVLVYRTAVELCTLLTLKIRNMGVVKNSDTNVQSTSAGDVKYMAEYYETFYYDAVNRLMDFLCENKDAFVEIEDGFCTCSSKPRYGRTGLWLGK